MKTPYATTVDLLESLRPVMPAEWECLVDELFEKVTMCDISVASATSTARPHGTFLVRVDVKAHKRRTDDTGDEQETPIDDWVDIALFGEEKDGQRDETELLLERRRISASSVAFEIVVGQRPVSVAIDPHYKLIERDRSDNARALSESSAAAERVND